MINMYYAGFYLIVAILNIVFVNLKRGEQKANNLKRYIF